MTVVFWRRLHKTAHWTQFGLLLGMISIQEVTAGWVAPYAAVALGWPVLAAIRGLYTRPGPKLSPGLKILHRWHHIALYAGVFVSGILAALWLTGREVPLQYWLFILFMVSLAHGMFHLWRHTALLDGALRIILPTALHKHL
ncbi:hypothetical protein HKCCE3408_16375 [Rhodobacterales bacterium HKCCE3408]|nr:hypothetical protein [Rhodobacterales bacterium HKCCE3408]